MAAITDLNLIASGKVREIYDLGDELLIVASDRISTYDAVHPNPIPDKGAVLTAISTFWFEQTGNLVPNHLVSVTDGVPDRGSRSRDGRQEAEDAAGRGRRAWLHRRLRLEGLPEDRHRLRSRSCPTACASRTSCRSRSSPHRPRPTSGTTRRSTSSRRPS